MQISKNNTANSGQKKEYRSKHICERSMRCIQWRQIQTKEFVSVFMGDNSYSSYSRQSNYQCFQKTKKAHPGPSCANVCSQHSAGCSLSSFYRINFHIDRPLVRYYPAFQSFRRNRRFYCANNRHRHHCRANGRRLHCHSSSDIAPQR